MKQGTIGTTILVLILAVQSFAGEHIKTMEQLADAIMNGRSFESVGEYIVNPVEYVAEEVASGRIKEVPMKVLIIIHPFSAGSHGIWIKVYEDCLNAGYDETRCGLKVAAYITAWCAGVYVLNGRVAYDTYVQECVKAFEAEWQDYVADKKATKEFTERYLRNGVEKKVMSLNNYQERQACLDASHKKYEAALTVTRDTPAVQSGCSILMPMPEWMECERAFRKSGKATESQAKALREYDAENTACYEKWGRK